MPRYFGQKGHNKQTWLFQKTHPQLQVLQKEAKAHMSFFDQLDQCLQQQQQRNQRALEGTPSPSREPTDPSIATQASTSKTTVNKQPDLITVEPMDQNSQTHLCKEVTKNSNGSTTGRGARDISNFGKEIMSVTDYMKAV